MNEREREVKEKKKRVFDTWSELILCCFFILVQTAAISYSFSSSSSLLFLISLSLSEAEGNDIVSREESL